MGEGDSGKAGNWNSELLAQSALKFIAAGDRVNRTDQAITEYTRASAYASLALLAHLREAASKPGS